MADCTIIGEVKNGTGTGRAAPGTLLTAAETQIPNVAHSTESLDFYVHADGTLRAGTQTGAAAKFARGTYVRFRGKVSGFITGKKWVLIPDAATVDINVLSANANASPPPSTAVSQAAFNAAVAELQGQLDLLTPEWVMDTVAALLRGTDSTPVTYNDPADTLTLGMNYESGMDFSTPGNSGYLALA